ncbi:MAG: serine hydrolase [Acidobacteria bacterium]|nr:MAG: serine hydrolase [Acidobacteriota bacterium]
MAVLFGAGILFGCTNAPPPPGAPGAGWPVSQPAAQGMDAAALAAIDAVFASGSRGYVDAMLVIRHGQAVFDRQYAQDYVRLFAGKDPVRGPYNYYDPDWHPWYRKGDLHTLQSVTKSVTSALIGIAIGRGEIPGVDVPVLRYFDEAAIANLDERKRRIVLRDLLTMTAGIKWDEDSVPYTDPANSCAAMEASADWARYVIDQPMEHDPGHLFRYSSGVSEILAHILWKATGRQADEYAAEHLFGPLGIERFYWKRTPTGLPDTEGGLYLARSDLARFGALYLHDGVWNGRRVLPVGWVAESMRPRADPGAPDLPGVRYGYQWWLMPWGEGKHFAWTCWGYGGQFLFVVPERDLVAVFNGWNIYDRPELDPKWTLGQVLGAAVGP